MTKFVAPHEAGVIRVFSLSMSDAEARRLRDGGSGDLARLLGVDSVDPAYVEVFPLDDLGDLGLAGYLAEGNGVPVERLNADADRLGALDGWVLIAYSSAFQGKEVTLDPDQKLTLIATYSEPGTDWQSKRTLKSAAAQRSASPAAPEPPSERAISGRVALIALAVIALLTVVIVLIAG